MNDCKTRSGRAFDRQAWTYDTARFGSHARGLYPVLLEQLAQIPHGSVLDVGCGTGELLREVGLRFPETAQTGLDLSANMLAVAREKLGGAVELVQGDAERLPFANRRFEVLLCNDSFHHYPNPGAAAAEFARVLQPGGVLLLGDCTAPAGLRGVANCWVSVKQFSKNDTATACQDWLRSTRLGRGSIKSHVRTVKVLGMGLFAFQERIHLWKGVTH